MLQGSLASPAQARVDAFKQAGWNTWCQAHSISFFGYVKLRRTGSAQKTEASPYSLLILSA